ncbi:acetyl coenzyme A synthetase (ADP forming), alpha domain [Roseibium album]|nr:acetyl coenzyme A synthetase (ADP forming), alpha domain [Roseibium album]
MRSLERLLRPRSIAVVGGGSWCENVIRECAKSGYAGNLWAVHPKRESVAGCAAVPEITDLPSAPDAVFIGVNRHTTIDIVRELTAVDAGGAVCFASGFSEASAELEDGADLQDALLKAAGQMPIFGPNCYGFINAMDGASLWPDQHGLTAVQEGVAIISQSSNIALNLTMQSRGLPIAYLMTVGNQAQTGLSAIGQALLSDPRVSAIGLHIEGIDDLAAFEQFARNATEKGKPLVALKVGKSEQAQAATISHTASLSGTDAGARALFKRLGIAQVESLPVLLETLKLVHVVGKLPNARIVSMSCSGGEASLIADAAANRKVSFPPLDDAQKDNLRAVLGTKVALANPLDYHTYIWGDVEAMARTFSAMTAADIALGIVVLDIPRPDRCEPSEWLKVIDAIELAMARTGKPMAVLSSLTETLPEKVAQDLIARGIVPLCGLDEAIAAIEAASLISKFAQSEPIKIPVHSNASRMIGETDAKRILTEYGVKAPLSETAASAEAAARAADRIGYPVVLKGTGLAHKTEAGAVALDLSTAESVALAADAMPTTTFLIEEMVSGTIAELLVGVVKDPAHGFILTLAAGGVLTELLQDRVSLVMTASRQDVGDALRELKIARILSGYRGGPSCDLELIVDAVMAVQNYVTSAPVEEVEINPLLCGRDFAIAADALIRCGEVNDG